MASNEDKEKVLHFIRREVDRGQPPSLRPVVKKLGGSNSRFYKIFQNGLKQAYEEAGCGDSFRSDLADRMRTLARSHKRGEGRSADVSTDSIEAPPPVSLIQLYNHRKQVAELTASIKELEETFFENTEGVKDYPFWNSKRQSITSQCEALIQSVKHEPMPADASSSPSDGGWYGQAQAAYADLKAQCKNLVEIKLLSEEACQLEEKVSTTRAELAEDQWRMAELRDILHPLNMPLVEALRSVRPLASVIKGASPESMRYCAKILEEAMKIKLDPARVVSDIVTYRITTEKVKNLQESALEWERKEKKAHSDCLFWIIETQKKYDEYQKYARLADEEHRKMEDAMKKCHGLDLSRVSAVQACIIGIDTAESVIVREFQKAFGQSSIKFASPETREQANLMIQRINDGIMKEFLDLRKHLRIGNALASLLGLQPFTTAEPVRDPSSSSLEMDQDRNLP